jgi:hypothetical protein
MRPEPNVRFDPTQEKNAVMQRMSALRPSCRNVHGAASVAIRPCCRMSLTALCRLSSPPQDAAMQPVEAVVRASRSILVG